MKASEFCTCIKCGWVHMAYSREFAEQEVARFNDFYYSVSENVKEHYKGPSSIDNYTGCRVCGGNEFRESRAGDCPDGCTISPVIWENCNE